MNYQRIACFLAAATLAMPFASSGDAITNKIAQKIAAVVPDTEITSIAESEIPGLYEVMLGPSLMYMSENAQYVFRGDILDIDAMSNITKRKRALARQKTLAGLDPAQLVTFQAANEKHTLYVFTDIDCGYCRKLHQQMAQMNNAGITVRYLAYPRAGLDSEASAKLEAVWCSADQVDAMTAAKNGKDVTSENCPNPVEEHMELGQAMGVSGTPAVYTEGGEKIGGYVPVKDLVKILSNI
ncbi:MAG: DsbC family protein [Pseudomonadota bacterium]